MASLSEMMADKGKVIERLKQNVTTQIQYIHYSKLKPSKENFYGQVNIEDLADAILLAGMIIEPLAVHKTDMGEYEVISGHRRRLASILNVERGHKKFEQIPCIIITASDELLAEIDEMLQENGEEGMNAFDAYIRYILITANSTAREPTDYERMEQAMQLKKIIPFMRGDESLKGRALRAVIAQEMNRSMGTVSNYETIYKHLIPEGMELFKTGQIKVTVALGLSQLPDESQKRLIKLSDLSTKDIEFEKETLSKNADLKNAHEKEAESRISTKCGEDFETVTETVTEKETESRISTKCEAYLETEYENWKESDINSDKKEPETHISTKCEGDLETVPETVTEETYPEKSICTEKSEKEYTKADIEEQLRNYLSYKIKFKEEDKNSKYGRKILLMCDALQMLLDNFD